MREKSFRGAEILNELLKEYFHKTYDFANAGLSSEQEMAVREEQSYLADEILDNLRVRLVENLRMSQDDKISLCKKVAIFGAIDALANEPQGVFAGEVTEFLSMQLWRLDCAPMSRKKACMVVHQSLCQVLPGYFFQVMSTDDSLEIQMESSGSIPESENPKVQLRLV